MNSRFFSSITVCFFSRFIRILKKCCSQEGQCPCPASPRRAGGILRTAFRLFEFGQRIRSSAQTRPPAALTRTVEASRRRAPLARRSYWKVIHRTGGPPFFCHALQHIAR